MKILIALLIPFFILLSSCRVERDESLSILTYNLYLMFDDVEDGDEYHPFTKSGGYTKEDYHRRIEKYLDFFLSDEGSADIYVLCEVESEKVLKDLISGKMYKKGYKYYGILDDTGPISVGFISRIPIENVLIHSNDGPRPILELRFFFRGNEVRLFAIHAKSRLDGGDEERWSTFEHLSHLMTRSHPSLVIAAGDFNEDPRRGESFSDVTAALSSPLHVTGDPVLLESDVFYAAILDPAFPSLETYYYDDLWYAYDHILLGQAAFDALSLEHSYTAVVYPPGAVDEAFRPLRYDVETGEGYSDHLAVKTVLRYY